MVAVVVVGVKWTDRYNPNGSMKVLYSFSAHSMRICAFRLCFFSPTTLAYLSRSALSWRVAISFLKCTACVSDHEHDWKLKKHGLWKAHPR